jgi:ATP-dependent RNA helicase DeaD
VSTFKELGVKSDFLKALKEMNIETPTEIQIKTIPYLLEKQNDFIGKAPTGTGKTAAFGLPILHHINTKSTTVQAVILAPTRELGQQIAKQLFKFTKYSEKVFTEAVYGGERIEKQIARLKRPTQIIVATPGRLVELVEKKIIDLSKIKTMVLDEADEMLSMGFKKDLDFILSNSDLRKNVWLFSATMPPGIKQIIKNYMSPGALKVEFEKENATNKGISHQFIPCTKDDKLFPLVRFIQDQENESRGIIFCKTKASAQILTKQLRSKNMFVDCIHGDLKQIERDKVMRAFKSKKLKILIATDISARGIDIENLAYVAHYQLPDQIDYYTHRSGRTARAGRKGLSVCFVVPTEQKRLKAIEKALKIRFEERAK